MNDFAKTWGHIAWGLILAAVFYFAVYGLIRHSEDAADTEWARGHPGEVPPRLRAKFGEESPGDKCTKEWSGGYDAGHDAGVRHARDNPAHYLGKDWKPLSKDMPAGQPPPSTRRNR